MESLTSVRVVRNDPCVAWGFRISGGRDFGAPVTIQRVNPRSVADRHGLQPRDLLISIEGQPTSEMKHSEVQQQIKNAEKVLNLELKRPEQQPARPKAHPDPMPDLAQLKIKGSGMEQPASGSRFAQPFQASTSETTMPTPYQAVRSAEVVKVEQVKVNAPAQVQVKVQPQPYVSSHGASFPSTPSNPPAPPPPPPPSAPAPVRVAGQPTPWQPPPPPSAVAARPASLGDDDSPALSAASGHKAAPADLRAFGAPVPPPPMVAPKPAADRKFSADANLVLGGGPAPWKPQDERKGSLDVSLALSESGLQPVGARKSSWDPTSGERYTAQPWRPPTAVTSAGKRPSDPGDRKGSVDKISTSTPMGYTAQPWKPPAPAGDDDRRPSWDKSSTLPPMGYTAKPWKPPGSSGDDDRRPSWDKGSTLPPSGNAPQPWKPPGSTDDDVRRPSWDKSSTLPPSGNVSQPWKPPGSAGDDVRRPSWDKSSTLPPSGNVSQPWKPPGSNGEDVRKPSWDKSASLPPAQPWKAADGERKGSLPPGNERPGSGKKHEAGVCFHCKETIRGPYLMALDRVYCADHFRCCKCNVRLDKQPFIAHENEVFCQEDYGKFIAEKCAVCGSAIITECLRAMDKAFHPECFTCTLCREPIAPGNFRLGSDNKPYCEDDWRANFQVMCSRCDFPIEPDERFIEALNKSFHAECFECVTCGMKLEGKPFYNRNDKPYCREHVPAH